MAYTVQQSPEIKTFLLNDDGTFPNNERLSLLIYERALQSADDLASAFEEVFESNGWSGCWRNGIYPYHHYHSTAHEVLGVSCGSARVQLGGEAGEVLDLAPGYVLIIPAGVAHKNLGSSTDFQVVGAYPRGQQFDMNYGKPSERPAADRNISKTALPESDPVFGEMGPLVDHWKIG